MEIDWAQAHEISAAVSSGEISADAVIEAAHVAADVLTGHVQPWAHQLMEEHRTAGRLVVLATTTPFDVVKPFADRLGLDDVVATRYGQNDDGTYNGSIRGNFVWGTGKLAAVRSWADERGIDLRDCHAYSDSVYDTPLLRAVGYPTAVNPDPRLAVLAAVRRWPVLHLDVPPGVPKVIGLEPLQALRPLLSNPAALAFARFDIQGVTAIPQTGPAILVCNHRSYFDPVVLQMVAAKVGRTVRFLAKKELFDAPVVGQFMSAVGAIRVDRGSGSSAPLEAAARALRAGELVAVLPQGTIPRGPEFFDPDLKGRPGAARLARAEDKDATSDAKMQRLRAAYLAKARKNGVKEEAIKAIETYFADISAEIRQVEPLDRLLTGLRISKPEEPP